MPCGAEQNLYLRPFTPTHSAFLAVKSLTPTTYMIIASLPGAYFGGSGAQSVKIWVPRDFSRTAPGGAGFARCDDNYAASMVARREAKAAGCGQVAFLDTVEHRCVEELGGMNLLTVTIGDHVITLTLTDSILEGATCSAILRLVADAGLTAEECHLLQQELYRGIDNGSIHEVFTCDTTTIVAPVASFTNPDGAHTAVDGQPDAATLDLCRQLTKIRCGRRPDPCGWMYRIV